MTNTTTMLPCPFCGAHPTIRLSPEGYNIVVCEADECAVNPATMAGTWDEAIEMWNKRALVTVEVSRG